MCKNVFLYDIKNKLRSTSRIYTDLVLLNVIDINGMTAGAKCLSTFVIT